MDLVCKIYICALLKIKLYRSSTINYHNNLVFRKYNLRIDMNRHSPREVPTVKTRIINSYLIGCI